LGWLPGCSGGQEARLPKSQEVGAVMRRGFWPRQAKGLRKSGEDEGLGRR